MKSAYDSIEEWRVEMKSYVKNGTVKDPALYWAGKLSQMVRLTARTSLIGLGNHIALLDLIAKEYDEEIFKRIPG